MSVPGRLELKEKGRLGGLSFLRTGAAFILTNRRSRNGVKHIEAESKDTTIGMVCLDESIVNAALCKLT